MLCYAAKRIMLARPLSPFGPNEIFNQKEAGTIPHECRSPHCPFALAHTLEITSTFLRWCTSSTMG